MKIDWQATSNKIEPLFSPLNPYSGINTDLYELTTGIGFRLFSLLTRNPDLLKYRLVHDAFFREFPAADEKKGDIYGYVIQSGVGPLVDFLLNAHFSKEDIAYLKSLPPFNKHHVYLKHLILENLEDWRFTGDMEAVPEGMPIAPFMPLARIAGKPFDTHLAETMTLMCLNTGTALSTKARRITYHTRGLPVIDMSFRRMLAGIGGTLELVRALTIGGFSGTSHTQAAKILGLRPMGTHPHSWVIFWGSDKKAFEIYGLLYPENYCALLDTFDTLKKGVIADIEITKKLILRKLRVMENQAEEDKICHEWSPNQWRELLNSRREDLGNVAYYARNDSGDQEYYTHEIWRAYEEAGLSQIKKIIISGDLDEYLLHDILGGDALAHAIGVGTKAVSGLISTGIVYKLTALIEPNGSVRSVVKGTSKKSSMPYPNVPLVLFGSTLSGNTIRGYVLCLPEEIKNLRDGGRVEIIRPYFPEEKIVISFDSAEELLHKIINGGSLAVPREIFTNHPKIIDNAEEWFKMLPKPHKRLFNPQRVKYGFTPSFFEARKKLIECSNS